jgi:competence protein ComEC
VRLLQTEPEISQLLLGEQTWLWLGDATIDEQEFFLKTQVPPAQVLLWSGTALSPALVEKVRPKTAIAAGQDVNRETIDYLKQQNIVLYQTNQDGGIQWTRDRGFQTTLDSNAPSF